MCTLYSRHNLRHEDISIHIGSCFQGTRTAHFYKWGLFKCSRRMGTFSMLHFHFKERSFDFHSKGGDLPAFSPRLIPWPFQASLEVCGSCRNVKIFRRPQTLVSLQSSRKLPGLGSRPPPHTVSSQRSGFQEYALWTRMTVDIVAAHSMQWAGPGLSTGSHVEWKEGLPTPPPHTHTPPPLLTALWLETVPETRIRQTREAQMVVLEMKELSSWLRWHQGERLLFLSAPLLLSSWTP